MASPSTSTAALGHKTDQQPVSIFMMLAYQSISVVVHFIWEADGHS